MEEDVTNLTLEKLHQVMDKFTPQEFCDHYMGIYNRIAKENSIKPGDIMIISKSWYDDLPNPKPSWLKGSPLIKEGEGYVVPDIPLSFSFNRKYY